MFSKENIIGAVWMVIALVVAMYIFAKMQERKDAKAAAAAAAAAQVAA